MRARRLLDKDGRIAAREYVINRAFARAFPLWQRAGVHVIRNSFYGAVPDTRLLPADIHSRRSALVGIEIDEQAQLAMIADFADRFAGEYAEWPQDRDPSAPNRFFRGNTSFGPVDAETYWCMLRSRKPTRVIEIGSGNSTLLALDAMARNAAEGSPIDYTVIDPFPRVVDAQSARGGFTIIEQPVQRVPLETFASLQAGDILFIDSTHVVAMDSDVVFEILEVLPRLNPGVLIHLHDILLPMDYPQEWLDHLYFWTEQYLLQAFLAFNDSFAVRWAGNLMALDHPEALHAAYPAFEPGRHHPGSVWIERVR